MSEQMTKNPWAYFAGGVAAGLVFTTFVLVIAFVALIQPTYDKQTAALTQVSQQRDACIEAQNLKAAIEAEHTKQQGITLTVPLPASR